MLLIITNLVFFYIYYYKIQNKSVPYSSSNFSSLTEITDSSTFSNNTPNEVRNNVSPQNSPLNSPVSPYSSSNLNSSHNLAVRTLSYQQEPAPHLILSLLVAFITFFFFLFVTGLFGFHSFLITKGRTTHEQVTHKVETVFSTTCGENWKRVFCTAVHENYLFGYPAENIESDNRHILVQVKSEDSKPVKEKKLYELPSGRQRQSTESSQKQQVFSEVFDLFNRFFTEFRFYWTFRYVCDRENSWIHYSRRMALHRELCWK